ncbi:hypothetical protein M404DRAFT_696887 [Pisolithus tinctorius Marx 270]|uniref:DNA replication factor Cdt1 C-terminal domain-containing protein n=1 Tax=Pisolithus tinctorius Marx 270 TaxID=870435 RepID=A0A0C3PUC4_PISTI|nr:hypothetical protein M404DRAFT_696887 [Pisolithus tinctorius Marx 270]
MTDVYASLGVSPKKKRKLVSSDDESTFTPKKLRNAPPTPPKSAHKHSSRHALLSLPPHLTRLATIQTTLQHALSHALATCAVSPSETGIIRNVLNHVSISTYSGLATNFDVNDLKRLCWIWEWDGKALPEAKGNTKPVEEDNPFLDSNPASSSSNWIRGAMGLVISPTSHYSKAAGKRIPVYGLGIDVEMDLDKGMEGGMAAVARWTADTDKRRAEFQSKLQRWVKLHRDSSSTPDIPTADLPELPVQTIKASSLTRSLASASPKGAEILKTMVPSSPTSPSKSERSPIKRSTAAPEFAIPFPTMDKRLKEASPTKTKTSLHFPQTPSSHQRRSNPLAGLLTPKTPARQRLESDSDSLPSTPVSQRGPNAETAPPTPNTSRRQALYERVRLKSLTASPTKAKGADDVGGKLSRDQIQKMSQEEIRRRCLLGRLSGVAESVWMLFSATAVSTSAPTTRKRKALPTSQVAAAIIKSSPVPMSALEAAESLKLLTTLCPFFLRQFEIGNEEWLEMPPSGSNSEISDSSEASGPPTKSFDGKLAAPPSPGWKLLGAASIPPPSPGSKGRMDSAEEVHTRSPRRVRREAGGLREVREIIRRELEFQD